MDSNLTDTLFEALATTHQWMPIKTPRGFTVHVIRGEADERTGYLLEDGDPNSANVLVCEDGEENDSPVFSGTFSEVLAFLNGYTPDDLSDVDPDEEPTVRWTSDLNCDKDSW